jgi:hypothetical protein
MVSSSHSISRRRSSFARHKGGDVATESEEKIEEEEDSNLDAVTTAKLESLNTQYEVRE